MSSTPGTTRFPTRREPADIVGCFVHTLRRRDLEALAALLLTEGDAGAADAARDRAQVVLRSFGGSGLVDTELHPSTDGRTVFVEFGPDTATGHRVPGQPGVRLLRFTTDGVTITDISEYTEARPTDRAGAGAGLGDRAGVELGTGAGPAGAADWPSLGRERCADDRRGG